MHRLLITHIDLGPGYVGHKGIDVRAGGGTEVHVVRVFVHVQRQDGGAARHCVCVVGGPLVDQRALARLKNQQHPAGAAAEGFAHGDELLAPAFDTAEVGVQRQFHRRLHGLPITTQACEVQLVQQHRIGGDQFFAFQAIQLEAGRIGKLRLFQRGADGVEPLDRAAVVVVEVTAQQPLRQAVQGCRVKRQGLNHRVHKPSFSNITHGKKVAASPASAQAASRVITPTLKRNRATAAATVINADTKSKRPAKPWGHHTW